MASLRALWLPILAMAVIIVASNILVKIPINDLWTWGAFTFPFAFLITDLTNRFHGAANARLVVYVGFAIGVAASLYFADPRIALASGTAFLVAQLVDVKVFDKLRNSNWWIAPFFSSVVSTVLDTWLFFVLAFAGSGLAWHGWAIGDLLVKWSVALVALLPYGVLVLRKSAKSAV